MRKRSESSTQIAANVGRLMAAEFQNVINHEEVQQSLRAIEHRRFLELTGTLRSAIYASVDDFNRRMPKHFELIILDKGDHLVFNLLGKFTLMLTYGKGQVTIQPQGPHSSHDEPVSMEIEQEGDGLHFRDCSSRDRLSGRVVDQTAFLKMVIRMACSPRLQEQYAS